MLDKKGVMRGACLGCEEGCTEYSRPTKPDDDKCTQCSCPPHKHQQCTRTSWSRNSFVGFSGFFKGVKSFNHLQGYKYAIKYSATGTGSSVVRVLDTTLKGKKNWIFRIDKPHGAKVPYEHINVNPKIAGIAKDPHLWLPPGSPQVAKGTAKIAQVINKVALPVAIAAEAVTIGKSVCDDVKQGTTRNTVEAVAKSAGGWGFGFGGGAVGATIGTAMLPGVGTIVGGIIGSIGGAMGGSEAVGAVVEKVADGNDFGLEDQKCKLCNKPFKIRKYKGEENELCEECRPSVIELKCQACDENFSVQIYPDASGFFATFYHSFCPIISEDQSHTISSKFCNKCGCVFKTSNQSSMAPNLCPLCSSEEFKLEVDDKKADVSETLHLNCDNCEEEVFLRLSANEGRSEFQHKYCPKIENKDKALNISIK